MPKPPKTPRPIKAPVTPVRDPNLFDGTVGLLQYRLIGRVAVEWARLENVMDDFIWHMLEIDIEQGRIITTRLDATAKIRTIRELAPVTLSEAEWHKLSPLLDRADILRDERNLIIHGTWGRDDSGIPISLSLKVKPLNPDEVVSEQFSEKRMRSIAHDIDAVKFQLRGLMKEFFA
jgi:hypothetical protein